MKNELDTALLSIEHELLRVCRQLKKLRDDYTDSAANPSSLAALRVEDKTELDEKLKNVESQVKEVLQVVGRKFSKSKGGERES